MLLWNLRVDVRTLSRGESGDLLVGLKKLMKQDTDCKLPVISSENMCIGVLAGAHSAINYGTRFSFIYKPRFCALHSIVQSKLCLGLFG